MIAEVLAREALSGFFGDDSFTDMKMTASRRAAVARVNTKLELAKALVQWGEELAYWEALQRLERRMQDASLMPSIQRKSWFRRVWHGLCRMLAPRPPKRPIA